MPKFRLGLSKLTFQNFGNTLVPIYKETFPLPKKNMKVMTLYGTSKSKAVPQVKKIEKSSTSEAYLMSYENALFWGASLKLQLCEKVHF